MIKFRTSLLVTLVSLIIAILLGLGLLLGQLFKGYYLQQFNEHLKKESNFIGLYINDHGGLHSINKNELLKISQALDVRVTLTNNSGMIENDSGIINKDDSGGLEEKIHQVVKKTPKNVERVEEGNGYDLHYYWKPIFKGEKQEGYLFLSTKTSELKRAYSQIWWILSISLGIALIAITFLGIRITSRYTRPIESATNVAIELSKGNYRARTTVDRMDVAGALNSSINVLAGNLQEMVNIQEFHQDRLTALIENIGAGLILIDSRGYINLINKGYIEIFKVDPADYLNRLYYEVMEHQKVSMLVEEIFKTEQKINRQMLLPLMIERKYFDVYGVPIIGTDNVWKGVLLVFHDITELKKLEQMRKDFVANVSHELKTPITSIRGFSETLLDGAMDDKKVLNEFLHIILKESDRLQSLVQDILDLSKIEQQGFELNFHKFDLLPILREVIKMLDHRAEEKNIMLDLKYGNEVAILMGDMHRLKQVFINLISNALAYTPFGGIVIVTVLESGNKIHVKVRDSGTGIEKDEIPRIFERFYRVDRARDRDSGGTGLGLAIVKHIVEAHHGTIAVTSVVDKGSEFTIELDKNLQL